MKHPFVKMIICIIVTVILTIALAINTGVIISMNKEKRLKEQAEASINNLSESFRYMVEVDKMVDELYEECVWKNIDLTKIFINTGFVDEEYVGPTVFSDGVVVKYHDGIVEIPEEAENTAPELTAEIMEKALQKGISFDDRPDVDVPDGDGDFSLDVLTASHIRGDYYYVDWKPTDYYAELFISNVNLASVAESIEKAWDVNLAVVRDDYILYWPTIGRDLDLEKKILNKDIVQNEKLLIGDDKEYTANFVELEDSDITVYTFTDVERSTIDGANWTIVFFIISFLICITVLTWNMALQNHVRNYKLSELQERRYNPAKVRMVNIIIGFIGALIIFSASMVVYSMNTLREDVDRGNNVLSILRTSIKDEAAITDNSTKDRAKWYEYYGKKFSELSERFELIPDKEMLKEINDRLECQYIIIYDENGNQLESSNQYVGFSLGTAKDDPTTDFRRLLHGVESIVHEPAKDAYTDLYSQEIGAALPMKEKQGFGAVILALDPENYSMKIDYSVEQKIRDLVPDKDILLIVDNETDKVAMSNNVLYCDMDISSFGVKKENKLSEQMNLYHIAGDRYYCSSALEENNTYYYFVRDSINFKSAFGLSITAAIMFVIVYSIVIFIMNIGYNREYFELNAVNGKPVKSERNMRVILADGRNKRSTDVSERFLFVPKLWWNLMPEQKASFIFNLLLSLVLILVFFFINRDAGSNGDLLITYIMLGQWERGINIFAVFSTILLVGVVVLIMSVLKNILLLISLISDTKGETLCRLIYNLLQYVALIVTLYYAFGYFGFNTTGLLASVGFVTLAVSMGSRDLVADVLAGITIVFEGVFQIGDMVDIGGYRGQVQEIGVRSTKIMGQGNNVKIIGNRDVKNVLNLTRMNSWIPLEVKVSNSQPLEEIEALLDEQLPKIGKKIDKIVSGPYYYGVLGFDDNNIILSIMTECREEDYHHIQRELNKEMYNLFKNKKISVKNG